MSHKLVTLVAVVMFSATAAIAFASEIAYPTFESPGLPISTTSSMLGPTGLLITPTAMIAPARSARLFYHEISADPKLQGFLGVTVPLTEDLEVSATQVANVEPLPAEPERYRNEIIVNMKYRVPFDKMLDNPQAPKVAVGLIDANNQVDRVYYVAVSQPVPLDPAGKSAVTFHAGFGASDTGEGRLDGFFGGVDFVPFPRGLAQIEYDGDNTNAGVAYCPSPSVEVSTGMVNDDFTWGVSFLSNF
jgi:hypothetical protein